MTQNNNHTAAFAEAFFIANLLFIGIFYVVLWILYFLRYDKASAITQNHLKQTLVASTISSLIFLLINLTIYLTSGYNSISALIALEIYFMILVPIFFLGGIMGFVKAIKGDDFRFPLIGKRLNLIETSSIK